MLQMNPSMDLSDHLRSEVVVVVVVSSNLVWRGERVERFNRTASEVRGREAYE